MSTFSSLEFLDKHVFFLFFFLLPALFLLLKTRAAFLSSRSLASYFSFFLSLLLRIFALSCLILALADPVFEEQKEEEQISLLFDASKSMDKKAREAFLELAKDYAGDSSKKFRLIPFAENLGPSLDNLSFKELSEELNKPKNDSFSSSTNFEKSLEELSLSQTKSSFLLASDGQQTSGEVQKAYSSLKEKELKIFPLIPEEDFFKEKKLFISFIDSPLLIKAGDRVPISISAKNELEDKEVELLLELDGKKIDSKKFLLKENSEIAQKFISPKLKGGLRRLRTKLLHNKELVDQQDFFLSAQEAKKILLIAGNSKDNRQIRPALKELGYLYQEALPEELSQISSKLQEYRSIVFNNAHKNSLPKNFLEDLKNYVSKGGGLLILGGDKSFGLGGYIKTELEEISPLAFVEPQKKQRPLAKAVVLLIDKSRSMSKDDRMFAAKKAAFVAINALKDEDYIGVIGFDTAPFEVLQLDRASEVKKIAEDRLNNRLTPIGGTSLLDSLSLAKRRLRGVSAGIKHIIVLGDGEFQDASSSLYFEEVEAARRAGITISAVAIGGEADVPFMRGMAGRGGGSFYEVFNTDRLPEIFLEDIKVSSGELTLKEQEDFPVIEEQALSNLSDQNFPNLRGFVESKLKDSAKLALSTRSAGRAFPLLASWAYKQGVVVAFSSDLNGRWSSPWMTWSGYQSFLGDLLKALKSANKEVDKEISYDFRYRLEGSKLHFELSIFDELQNEKIKASLKTPSGARQSLDFKTLADGRFEASAELAGSGAYFIEMTLGKIKLPLLGFDLKADLLVERPGKGINVSLLSELAKISAGEINPEVENFIGKKSYRTKRREFFSLLLSLAFFSLLLEAFLRERGLANLFARKKKRK